MAYEWRRDRLLITPPELSKLLIGLLDVSAEKIDDVRRCLRCSLEQQLAGLANFKAGLEAHGFNRILEKVLIPRQ